VWALKRDKGQKIMKNEIDTKTIEWTRDARFSHPWDEPQPSTIGTLKTEENEYLEGVSWGAAQAYAGKKNLPLDKSPQCHVIEWWRDGAITRAGDPVEPESQGFYKTENYDIVYGTFGEAQAYADERDMILEILPD
jgi:hypothetical protein